MKVRKPNPIEVAQKLGEELRRKPKEVKTWDDLIDNLKKQRLTPGETYRKLNSDNTRFNWKMIRLTLYVWERVEEDKSGYLKPKIDTVKAVVNDRRFKDLMYGYYPDLKFDYENEVNLLNKLIAEKIQRPYFTEGYYKYERTNKIIPQKHLDNILWPVKK